MSVATAHEDVRSVRRKLRVMTYNIHHGRGTDRRCDLDRIARVIEHDSPDVVALQEIEQYRRRTSRLNQPEELANKLGMYWAFARVRDHRLDDDHHHAAYGNAILSRYPITVHEHFNISYNATKEPRGCLHAALDVHGSRLDIFCVHLGLRYRERHYQIERLLSADIINNAKFGDGPKILLGDFNNWWRVRSAELINKHFHNACHVTGRKRLRTFGKYFSVLALDYIFTSRDIRILWCEVRQTATAMVASDHRPVVCCLEIPSGP
jgi:endonuclease/exonuclease/phosphatase family metal-dependent hydrolase